jgi:hypothetical protein
MEGGIMDILRAIFKARPDVQWKNNAVNCFDINTIEAAYIGSDFPSATELDAAWVLCQDDDRVEGIVEQLSSTDKGIIRVIEDLISVLVQKGGISLTDFSPEVQDKILVRQALRDEINGV